LLSYRGYLKKPLLFKSVTGLTKKEFDNIYHKQIIKRYINHEKRFVNRKDKIKRDIGAGRPFKLDVKIRFFMLLVHFLMYIISTRAEFLFDLNQSNICRDTQKNEF
jgi:hypothetical protein